MSQPHRKGHEFGSKAMQKKVERKQRQAQKVFLAGKTVAKKKHKPKKQYAPKSTPAPYPCGPKQMTLGESFKPCEGK